jgi:hypothetical protein
MATVYADYVLPVVPVYASSPKFTWMDGVAMVYWVEWLCWPCASWCNWAAS